MTLATRTLLDRDLQDLDDRILQMSSMVDEAIEKAMIALMQRDTRMARDVVLHDTAINDVRFTIEENALTVMSTQQPLAGDLRHIIAAIHIAVELERIGDHAADIASLAERLDDEPDFDSLHKLPKMTHRARKMIRSVVDAFIRQDEALATKMISKDEKIDRHYHTLRHDVLELMRDPDYIKRATFLLRAGHDVERIGDRATNIGERVIFMVTGQLVES